MLIASYNKAHLGDVLLTMVRPDEPTQASERKQNIVRIFSPATNETLGYNFFAVSEIVPDLAGSGQVVLRPEQVDQLNQALTAAGFPAELVYDNDPKFVVGHVETVAAHPDSDHLHIVQVTINDGQQLTLVCGAPNIAVDQRVVVAKVGAMMPNGMMIWPGKLRGVDSPGMVCSARELELPNAPQKRGILVLPEDDSRFAVGAAFDFAAGAELFA
ncbi:YtpR family tRNA-binding protein [Ligilactobacillus saerimneri]|uniref:tRNA-binding domain-containing protein n=1 Tax=Ligilactobacillus saerimneri 30a TaxID=1227363 RepID=M5J5W0_9LACO|nr:DUF4479 and tRNA-binding domain-containing protein [Ligilactobacillus saerimneri]EKW98735.1 tRNA-binding domain-containing protein [Ligilactobacillus saerimneri 30a]